MKSEKDILKYLKRLCTYDLYDLDIIGRIAEVSYILDIADYKKYNELDNNKNKEFFREVGIFRKKFVKVSYYEYIRILAKRLIILENMK